MRRKEWNRRGYRLKNRVGLSVAPRQAEERADIPDLATPTDSTAPAAGTTACFRVNPRCRGMFRNSTGVNFGSPAADSEVPTSLDVSRPNGRRHLRKSEGLSRARQSGRRVR